MKKLILILGLWLGFLLCCAPSFGQTSTFFGMQMNNNHYATLDDKLPDGTNYPLPLVPFGSVRLFDCNEGFTLSPKQGCHWHRVEPNATGGCSPASPCWTVIDHYLHELQTLGVTDGMFDLGESTPTWALNSFQLGVTCGNSGNQCWPPADIAASCTHVDGTGDCDGHFDGTNLTWRNWVKTAAQHFVTMQATYGVHVSGYELWNEWQRGPGTSTNWEFGGTPQQMRRLAQDARCLIVGTLNPSFNGGLVWGTNESCGAVQATVGLSGPIDATALMLSPSMFTSAANAGPMLSIANNYFSSSTNAGALAAADIVAVHTYSNGSAEAVWNNYNTLVGNLTNPGVAPKILWSTEGNYSGWGNLPSLDMESGYTAKIFMLLQSLGFQKVFLYGYDYNGNSTPPGGEGPLWLKNGDKWAGSSGTYFTCHETVADQGCLLPNGLTPVTAGGPGLAYQVVVQWLGGATLTTPCGVSGTLWTCGYTLANGATALAVWDSSKTCTNGSGCTTTPYPASGNLNPQWTSYSDVYGNVTQITTTKVNIGYNPILLQAGGVNLGACFTTDGSTPVSNGLGACSHGTLYSTPITVSTNQTIKAVSIFSGWTDSSVGSAAYAINYPLTLSSVTGLGSVQSSPSGINNCNSSCSALFASGSTVNLTATAGSGYVFSTFSGAGCGAVNPCPVTMSAAQSVSVTFVPNNPPLPAVSVQGFIF
jgi:hypothetical protein